MKVDALFFVLLITFNFAITSKLFSVDISSPRNKILNQLTQMKMQLLTSDDKIVSPAVFLEKIQEMLSNIEKDQIRHEAVNKNMTIQCSEEEKFRKIEIADAEAAFKASSEAEGKCAVSLAEGKKFLPNLEAAIIDYKNQIKVKTQERNAQHKKYLELQKEWSDAISFLRGFVKKIEETETSHNKTALLELNSKLIQRVAKIGRLEKLVPIFIALEGSVLTKGKSDDDDDDDDEVVGKNIKKATSSTKSTTIKKVVSTVVSSHNQSNHSQANHTNHTQNHTHNHTNTTHINTTHNVVKVNYTEVTKNITVKPKPLNTEKLEHLRKIVEELIALLVADSRDNDIQELNLMKSYELLMKEFNKIIEDLTGSIQRVKKQIEEMDLCVKKETVIMNSAAAKKLRNQNLLKIADRTCVDFLRDFVLATKDRKQEIESIRDILLIIKRRFGEFPSELLKQLNDLDGKFKHYVNTTQFEKYKEIVQVKIQDNHAGRALSGN